jgi:hypothetical protein
LGDRHVFLTKRVTINAVRIVYGLLGCFALIGAAWLLIPTPAPQIENLYSRGLFQAISAVVITATDLVPFSIAGVFLVLLPTALIAWVIVARFKPKRAAPRAQRFNWHWLWRAPLITFAIYGAFVTLWGANYRRLPIEEILGLTTKNVPRGLGPGLTRDHHPRSNRL